MAQTFPYRPMRPVAALREVVTNPYRLRYFAGRVILYAILIAGAIVVTIPFIWLVSSSLKPQAQLVAFPPIWISETNPVGKLPEGTYCLTVWSLYPEYSDYRDRGNSWQFGQQQSRGICVLTAAVALPGCCLLCAPANDHASGANYDDSPICTLFQVGMGVNTYLPLIVPAWFASPFYVFLMRQFFMGLPSELDDAARIDGASVFGIYWRIMLPLSKPVLATVALFSIQHHWNAFIGPLIYLHDLDKFTAAIGLRYFVTDTQVHYNLQMAASAAFTIPIIM